MSTRSLLFREALVAAVIAGLVGLVLGSIRLLYFQRIGLLDFAASKILRELGLFAMNPSNLTGLFLVLLTEVAAGALLGACVGLALKKPRLISAFAGASLQMFGLVAVHIA